MSGIMRPTFWILGLSIFLSPAVLAQGVIATSTNWRVEAIHTEGDKNWGVVFKNTSNGKEWGWTISLDAGPNDAAWDGFRAYNPTEVYFEPSGRYAFMTWWSILSPKATNFALEMVDLKTMDHHILSSYGHNLIASKNTRYLAGTIRNTARLWDLRKNTAMTLARPDEVTGDPKKLTFSPDGKRLSVRYNGNEGRRVGSIDYVDVLYSTSNGNIVGRTVVKNKTRQ